MPNHTRLLCASLAIFLSPLALARPQPQPATQPAPQQAAETATPTEDRWYEMWIEGARSGWTHETVTTADGLITSHTEMQLALKRGDQPIEIRQKSEFVETEEGKPVRMSVELHMGQTPTTNVYEFREDDVLLSTAQGEMTMPLPAGEWLAPEAAGRFVRQRLLSGATEITVRTLDPSNGLAIVTMTRSGIEPTDVLAVGKTVRGFRSNGVTNVGPVTIPSVEWFDDEGTLVRSETSIGTMKMTMVASTKELATAKADLAELMISTFVKPDKPIKSPRELQKASYRVSLSEGALPELVPSASQRAERIDERALRVTVDLAMHQAAGEVDPAVCLAATTYADKDDEVVAQITAAALKDAEGQSDAARAEALRRHVDRHIKTKDLGVAFATASETARSCEGDCSEHGVLLAAMLRAAGIPSRVAAGVVYVDQFAGQRGVFGYHMWTQALLDGPNGPEWVDLDATLGDQWAFDAAHIAFATSDLAEGETVSALAGIAPLLGALRIEVLD